MSLVEKEIRAPWLEYINSGGKIYEGRLNKGFWSTLKKGDEFIAYDNEKYTKENGLLLRVNDLKKYTSFGNAFQSLKYNLIPEEYFVDNKLEESKETVTKLYSEFFTQKDIDNHGVLAVGIEVVNNEDDVDDIPDYIKPTDKDIKSMKKKKENELFHKKQLSCEILVHPKELSHNISKLIEQKLVQKVEGICVNEGYIKPKSTKILTRSIGHINTENPTSSIKYVVNYKAEICHPSEGNIYTATVEYNNKTLVSAYIDDIDSSPLDITLFRQHHLGNSEFVALKKNDKIKIVVVDSCYSFLDRKITVIAHYISKV